jgi:hypothetical protein
MLTKLVYYKVRWLRVSAFYGSHLQVENKNKELPATEKRLAVYRNVEFQPLL